MGMAFDSEAEVGAGINFSDPNSPLARYYFRLGDLFAVSMIAAVFVLLNFTKLWHTDIWGHLKFGELWLQTRQFPTRDLLSFASDPAGGATNYAWLSQIIFSVTYRVGAFMCDANPLAQTAGGADALRALLALLVVARLTLLYLTFRLQTNSSMIAAMAIGFIVVVSIGPLAVLRPQTVADVLFAGLIFFIAQSKFNWTSTFFVALILVIWANAHASFPIGLITLAALGAGRVWQLLFKAKPIVSTLVRDTVIRWLTCSMMLGLIGITFVNPEGWSIWAKTAAMASHPNVRAMDEWQNLFAPQAVGARVTYFVCLGFIVGAMIVSQDRPTPSQTVLFLAFALPPLIHQRAIVWLITVSAWIFAGLCGSALARNRPTWWSSVPNFRRTIIATMIMVIAIFWSIPVRHIIDQKPLELARSVSDGTPWELAMQVAHSNVAPESEFSQLLKQTFPQGQFTGSIFTSETLGDFFIWPLRTPTPVFMYSHVHLYAPVQWRRFVDIRDAKSNWRTELDRIGSNLVVLYAEPQLPLAKELARDKNWKVILDETGKKDKLDPRSRLFAAVRIQPLLPNSNEIKK